MRTRLSLLTVALVLLIPAAASATLAGEQIQGQNLIGQLHARTKTCSAVSAGDLDHIGEYVMVRALGSTILHQAMNDRMRAMLGEQGETRMHQLLGARYVGCTTRASRIAGGAGMMGSSGSIGSSGMMGGYAANGGVSTMMSSGDWSWMMGGSWQHMTRQDWRHRQRQLLGPGAGTMMNNSSSAIAIIAACLGAVILVALAILAIIRRPFRRPPTAAATH
jgi:hypothetical protein